MVGIIANGCDDGLSIYAVFSDLLAAKSPPDKVEDESYRIHISNIADKAGNVIVVLVVNRELKQAATVIARAIHRFQFTHAIRAEREPRRVNPVMMTSCCLQGMQAHEHLIDG